MRENREKALQFLLNTDTEKQVEEKIKIDERNN